MKKILIITYYWPPSAGSGVQRWLKFAKYLPEFGWEPTIYTPENPEFKLKDSSLQDDISGELRVLRTKIWEPYSLIPSSNKKNANIGFTKSSAAKKTFKQKSLQWIRGNLFIPDPRVFWVQPSIKYLSQLLEQEDFDMIVSTGPPHSMHMIAMGLKKKFNIPWVADFRDPFSQMDVYDEYYMSARSRTKLEKIEQKILDNCTAFVSTSFSIGDFLLNIDPVKMHVITNGYDAENFKDFKDKSHLDDKIVLFHGGTMGEERNPLGLIDALNALKHSNSSLFKRIELRLAGNTSPSVLQSLKESMGSQLVDLSYLNHDSLFEEYQKANILLLLIHKTDIGRTCIPGKIYEYLAANKPILAFGDPQSDSGVILEKTKGGLIFDYEDASSIHQGLLKLIQEPKKYTAERESVAEFERKSLTEDYSLVLNDLIKNRN